MHNSKKCYRRKSFERMWLLKNSMIWQVKLQVQLLKSYLNNIANEKRQLTNDKQKKQSYTTYRCESPAPPSEQSIEGEERIFRQRRNVVGGMRPRNMQHWRGLRDRRWTERLGFPIRCWFCFLRNSLLNEKFFVKETAWVVIVQNELV